jgi:hypothetical protein
VLNTTGLVDIEILALLNGVGLPITVSSRIVQIYGIVKNKSTGVQCLLASVLPR